MSQSIERADRCRVVGGDKLPAETGGPAALCAAIKQAAQERAPGTDFSVTVQVLSNYSLSAIVQLDDGRQLPEQKMAISDRGLNRSSVEFFASAIAAEIARAKANGKG